MVNPQISWSKFHGSKRFSHPHDPKNNVPTTQKQRQGTRTRERGTSRRGRNKPRTSSSGAGLSLEVTPEKDRQAFRHNLSLFKSDFTFPFFWGGTEL